MESQFKSFVIGDTWDPILPGFKEPKDLITKAQDRSRRKVISTQT